MLNQMHFNVNEKSRKEIFYLIKNIDGMSVKEDNFVSLFKNDEEITLSCEYCLYDNIYDIEFWLWEGSFMISANYYFPILELGKYFDEIEL